MLNFGRGNEILTEGFWDITDEHYYADTSAISCSMLQCYMDSPRAFESRYILKNEDKEEESEAFLFGRAFHEYILRPARFLQEFTVAPKFGRTKIEQTKKAEWLVQNENKSIVSQKQLEKFEGMKNGLLRNKLFSSLLDNPKALREVAYLDLYVPTDYDFTNASVEPMWRKCKYDLVIPGDVIVDIKTTSSLEDASKVERSFMQYKYHCRDAWYLDIATKFDLAKRHLFCFVEKKWPHNTRLFYIDPELTDYGRRQNDKALMDFQKSLIAEDWKDPSEDQEPSMVSLPYWKRKPFYEYEETEDERFGT